MGIFDAVNTFQAPAVSQYSTPTQGQAGSPTGYTGLGTSQRTVNNAAPNSSLIGDSNGFIVSNGRYLGQQPLQTVPGTNYTVHGANGAYTRDLGAASTPQSVTAYSYITPAGYNQAAAAQTAQLGLARTAVNQYADPSKYFQAPTYNSMVPNINSTYSQAAQGYQALTPTIQDIISKFSSNPDLFPNATKTSQDLMAAYSQAKGQFGYVQAPSTEGGAGGPSNGGVTNIQQLYGNAAKQFDPYVQAGQNSADQLNSLQNGGPNQGSNIQAIMDNPIVQQQLQQGVNAINNSASAKGMLRSGDTLKQLQLYGQTNAGNAIQQTIQNLLSTANLGQQASGTVGNLYNQQNQAEMARANTLANLDTGQQASNFDQQARIAEGTLAANQGQLGAISAQQTNAGALAQILQNQSAASVAENQNAYNNNAQAAQATYNSQLASNQNYLNNLLNIYGAQGKVDATKAYGINQALGSYTY